MSRQFFRAALLFIVLAPVRTVQPQSGPGSIDGIIVRMGTSDPVADVNVEMRRVEGTTESPLLPLVYPGGEFSPGAVVIANAPNPGDSFYAKTGSDGHFTFTNLKPGKYRLLAAHPGGLYYPAEYGQRNPRGPGYDFSLQSPQIMRIRMEMAPMASVSGRITGENSASTLVRDHRSNTGRRRCGGIHAGLVEVSGRRLDRPVIVIPECD